MNRLTDLLTKIVILGLSYVSVIPAAHRKPFRPFQSGPTQLIQMSTYVNAYIRSTDILATEKGGMKVP